MDAREKAVIIAMAKREKKFIDSMKNKT